MIDDDGLPVLTHVLRTSGGVRVTPPEGVTDDADEGRPTGLSLSSSYVAPLDLPPPPWSRATDATEAAADVVDAPDGAVVDEWIERDGSSDDVGGTSFDAPASAAASVEAAVAANEPTVEAPQRRSDAPLDTIARAFVAPNDDPPPPSGPRADATTAVAPIVDGTSLGASDVAMDERTDRSGIRVDDAPERAHDENDVGLGTDERLGTELEIVAPFVDLVPPAPDPAAVDGARSSGIAESEIGTFDELDVAAFDDASDGASPPLIDARNAGGPVAPDDDASRTVAPDGTMFDDAAIDIESFASVAANGPSPDATPGPTMPGPVETWDHDTLDSAANDAAAAAATDDAGRWRGLSERVLAAVLEDLGARVDTEFDARIAQVVHAEIETAVGRLQHTLREHVADAIRDVVARAIEAEMVRRRQPDDGAPRG